MKKIRKLSRGVDLHYNVYGEGMTAILVHGFAEDATIWEFQARELKKKFRVIVPDLPGSGNSPYVAGLGTLADFAHILKELIDEEVAGPVVMIGHSMGGYITLQFAELFPGYLLAMGLFHSTSAPDDEIKKQTRRKGIQFILNNGVKKFLQQSIPSLFSDEFKAAHLHIVEELIQRYGSFNPLSLVQYYEAMIKRSDTTGLLKAVNKPVLFILGEKDTVTPIWQGLGLSILPEFSYIHILKHSAHMGMLEEKEKSYYTLEKFLSDV